MINRCVECGDIAPDFAELCKTCAYIEEQDKLEMENEDD